jgi:hypothetical protein
MIFFSCQWIIWLWIIFVHERFLASDFKVPPWDHECFFFVSTRKKTFIVKIIPGAKIADKVKLENTVANSPLVIVIVLIGKLFACTKMSYLESNYTKN